MSAEPSRPTRPAGPAAPAAPAAPAEDIAARVLSGSQVTAIWVGRSFLLLALILSAWIVVLAFTLPNRGVLAHQAVVWVGFDVGLLIGMVCTAWAALRRNRFLTVAAAATAALLMMDAWFDVVGSSTQMDTIDALVMAVLVELPLSAFCWWIALHSQTVAERRIASLVLWRSAAPADPPPTAEPDSDPSEHCIP